MMGGQREKHRLWRKPSQQRWTEGIANRNADFGLLQTPEDGLWTEGPNSQTKLKRKEGKFFFFFE